MADPKIDLNELPLIYPEDGVFESYSNVINADWTLYDVRLHFGELMQVPDEESPTWKNQHGAVIERALISMPWHQAKYLCNFLGGIVRKYEEVNGELKPVKLAPPPDPVKAG